MRLRHTDFSNGKMIREIAFEDFVPFGEVTRSWGTLALESGGGPLALTIPPDTSTPNTLTINGASASSTIDSAGDQDWFRITLTAGQHYVFSQNGVGLPDPLLRLFNGAGALIAIDDDGGPGANAMMQFTAVESGTYYISAGAFEDATGSYTISAATGAPQNPLDALDLGFTFQTTNINVYFATAGQDIGPLSAAVRSWTSAEIAAAMSALQTIANVTDLTFTQVGSSAGAHFIMALNDLENNVLGVAYPNASQAHVAFAPDGSGWTTSGLLPGGAGYSVIIHEAGHALGLAHPHMDGLDVQVMQGVINTFNSYGTFQMNQGVFTVMSYNDGWITGHGQSPSSNYGYSLTPMALDIAFLQSLYGADDTFNATNTTYQLSTVLNVGGYSAIWDAGGVDEIVYNGTDVAVIDLNAATLLNGFGGGGFVSHLPGSYAGYTIANGVVIENASAGSNNDTLTGNDVANVLRGNAGNDGIDGRGGVDTSMYAAASTGATWVRSVSGAWTVTAAGSGVDTLNGIERLDFTDRDVVLDNAQQTFSGNGTSDFLWRNANHGTVVIWEMTGPTQNSATIAGGAPADWTIVGAGDLNGDGKDDLIWRHDAGGVAGWLMNGASATSIAMVGGAPNEWSIAGIGDFNFDGKDDFVWRNAINGGVAVWLMNGLSSTSQSIISGAPLEWDIAAVADFDGDGRDDILLRHDDGTLARWTTDGVTQTGAAIAGGAPNEWQIAGTGDFDGDGRADILLRNANDGSASLWRMDGATQLGVSIIGAAPLEWSVAQIGDFSGDGKDDIIWRHDDGTIALWVMNGFSVSSVSIVGNVPNEWGLV